MRPVPRWAAGGPAGDRVRRHGRPRQSQCTHPLPRVMTRRAEWQCRRPTGLDATPPNSCGRESAVVEERQRRAECTPTAVAGGPHETGGPCPWRVRPIDPRSRRDAAHDRRCTVDVTLIHFSQTGNTRRVAETMAEALRAGGHAARTVSLTMATPRDAATSDLLGVGTPCFASQAPTPVKAFLRTLPPLAGSEPSSLRRPAERPDECSTTSPLCYATEGLTWSAASWPVGSFIIRLPASSADSPIILTERTWPARDALPRRLRSTSRVAARGTRPKAAWMLSIRTGGSMTSSRGSVPTAFCAW